MKTKIIGVHFTRKCYFRLSTSKCHVNFNALYLPFLCNY